MLNIKKLILYGLSVFMTGLISLNTSQAASVPNSSFINDNQSYQTAFIYFLPDYKDGELEGDNDHNREYCRKQGYTHNYKNCASPRILKDRCPVGNYYKQCYCAGSPSCTGSKSSSNPYPTSTGASMTSCVDCPGNTLYTWTCSSSTCASYQISGSCPSRGYCSRCCDGYYKLDSCQSGYHIEGSGSSATCVLTCVPAANETGCSYGTETCSDGCGGTRTCCKGCTPASDETGCSYGTYSCSDGCGGTRKCCSGCTTSCNLSSCPSNGNCSSECGKYCLNSCKSGYILDGNTCIKGCEKTETSCPDGYYLENQCTKDDGKTYGDCVDCMDENAPNNPCAGKYTCSGNGREPDGASTCTCGNVPYYDRCLVEETCNKDSVDENGGSCRAYTEGEWNSWASKGNYIVRTKCTKVDGTKIFLTKDCIMGSEDCNGNYPPAKGKRRCDGDKGTGMVECGGYKYFDTCEETCNKDSVNENGGSCYAYTEGEWNSWASGGNYIVRTKCTKADGTKIFLTKDCIVGSKDCNGNYPPAKGKRRCDGDKGTGMVECGGYKYFDTCEETCNTDSVDENGGSCTAYTESQWNSWAYKGSYVVRTKCTKADGTKIFLTKDCIMGSKDCNGNDAPAKGLTLCSSGTFPAGKTVECGGYTYAEKCLAECNYEFTEEMCTAEGKTFDAKCRDNNEVWYGECK